MDDSTNSRWRAQRRSTAAPPVTKAGGSNSNKHETATTAPTPLFNDNDEDDYEDEMVTPGAYAIAFGPARVPPRPSWISEYHHEESPSESPTMQHNSSRDDDDDEDEESINQDQQSPFPSDRLFNKSFRNNRYKKHAIFYTMLMLAVIIGAIVGAVVGTTKLGQKKRRDKHNDNDNNNGTRIDETKRLQFEKCLHDSTNQYRSSHLSTLQPLVEHNVAPATTDAINTPGSYQRAALCWLSEVDAFFENRIMDIGGSTAMVPVEDVIQVNERFVLASLYFHWVPPPVFLQIRAISSSPTTTTTTASGMSTLNWMSATTHVCEWDFVVCAIHDSDGTTTTTNNHHVTELSLDGMNSKPNIFSIDEESSPSLTSKEIPREVARLSDLVHLRLIRCGLTGTIPTELFDLTKLQVLDLTMNDLTGTIMPPDDELAESSFGQLRHLDLSNNILIGQIPALMFESRLRLEYLSVRYNKLTGSLPDTLSSATALTYLAVGPNVLTGTIPDLSRLTNLKELSMIDNPFISDSFPDVSMLTKLERLNLGGLAIFGSIPATSLSSLSNLHTLRLDRTRLTGSIPEAIGLLTALEYIQLQSSLLSGAIPSELGDLTNLTALDLSSLPDLTGTFPTELGRLSNLMHFEFPIVSKLSGTVPSEICNLRSRQPKLRYICGPSPPQCNCCILCEE